MSAGFKVISHTSPSLSLFSSCHSWGSWKQDQAYKRPGFKEQLPVSCLDNTRKFIAYYILILVPSSVAPNVYYKICFVGTKVLNFPSLNKEVGLTTPWGSAGWKHHSFTQSISFCRIGQRMGVQSWAQKSDSAHKVLRSKGRHLHTSYFHTFIFETYPQF